MNQWVKICELDDILPLGSRVIELPIGPVAIFRTSDDKVFAVLDECPHKQGPLSQGIVHDNSVTCPLHNWVIQLENGKAEAPDVGCVETFPVQLIDGDIHLSITVSLASSELIDG
ncbi:nitrite reductase small subunit NirD [Sneathiella marina]|uniref:Nitrite reductase small subunit NirD n=1 Tax=Sneathiella marina TaxID=2950108 RepID=A0ABY4W4R5_9PROT|nr:nitrite reductase small subunit NirD [Sneathiella marina]USG62028.1 nitrite reductase small subunit NirD [Sneathiella marina]